MSTEPIPMASETNLHSNLTISNSTHLSSEYFFELDMVKAQLRQMKKIMTAFVFVLALVTVVLAAMIVYVKTDVENARKAEEIK